MVGYTFRSRFYYGCVCFVVIVSLFTCGYFLSGSAADLANVDSTQSNIKSGIGEQNKSHLNRQFSGSDPAKSLCTWEYIWKHQNVEESDNCDSLTLAHASGWKSFKTGEDWESFCHQTSKFLNLQSGESANTKFRILEVASGAGSYAKPFLNFAEKMGWEVDYTGMEMSSVLTDVARRCEPRANFILTKDVKLAAKGRVFDGIVIPCAITYFDSIETVKELVKQLHPFLKTGGRIGISSNPDANLQDDFRLDQIQTVGAYKKTPVGASKKASQLLSCHPSRLFFQKKWWHETFGEEYRVFTVDQKELEIDTEWWYATKYNFDVYLEKK